MIDFNRVLSDLNRADLHRLTAELAPAIDAGMSLQRHGDLSRWLNALQALPNLRASAFDLKNGVTIGAQSDATPAGWATLDTQLRALIPWRKGPYSLFGIDIDTEWRSDWKWDRLLPHIQPLQGKTVLDVGCGNGYHCLRMHGAGAARVVGIDPSPRFVVQFYMLKKYLGDQLPVDVLPVGIEALPANLGLFDTTFSMGVFYHRRSPMDHLRELKDTLVPGGELVLETLVIDGELGQTLMPEGRYAMMNNVWFLPTCSTLASWLRKCGYIDVKVADASVTTTAEQRSTEWMTFHSLSDFLDADDASKTVEGHPAPKRAVIIAKKPLSA